MGFGFNFGLDLFCGFALFYFGCFCGFVIVVLCCCLVSWVVIVLCDF